MKKLIVVCLLVVAIGIMLYKHAETAVLEGIPTDHVVVFSQAGCPHCHDALEFIDKTIRPAYPQLKIEVLDIREDEENLTKLLVYAKHYHVADDQLGTPFIIYGSQYLMGWNASRAEEFESWLKK